MANAQIATLNITSHTPSEVVLNGTFGDVTASVSGGNIVRIGRVEKHATVELGLGTYIAVDGASNDTVISGSAGTNAAAYYSQGYCRLENSGMASPSRDALLLCQRSERFKHDDLDGGWTCGIVRDTPLECCAQLGQHLKSKEFECARREKRQRSRSMSCQAENIATRFDVDHLG
ncbi:hypothetical protein H632_c1783p0 [Helicosporidium sp. ATCC 50920]|nr:hypothetical protein H632_c1783p0 [Helicosporidium sp. ATCC 50920]|eukprot:KDD73856.1 hypothetical protein H632_c1783p0 [Helicosporidium sp. ATCC 50920]